MSGSSDLAVILARTTLARLRTLIPVLLIALVVSLGLSDRLDVPISPFVFAANLVVIALATTIYIAVRRDRLPWQHAHHAAAVIVCCAPTTTLASQWQTGRPSMILLVVLEIVAASVQLSTPHVVATAFLTAAAWLPLGIRDAGTDLGLQIAVMATAVIVAIVMHRMLLASIASTERARLEERAMEAARATLAESLVHAQRREAIGTLAAGLAHDMNNILAGIMSQAEALKSESSDPIVRRDMARIADEAERGAVLTRSLLAFSRKGQYRRRPVRLADVVGSVGTLLSRTLPKEVSVHHVVDAQPTIDVDIVQVGQVLVNLCINASDAMDGRGTLTIEQGMTTLTDERAHALGLPHDRMWARIAVSDTGHGIDDAIRERIFEPFFTTKPQGKGTGLGLSVVYGVVQAHGGAIEVTSRPGATRFEILLPITDRPPDEPARDRVAPVAPRTPQRQKILVVDDEPMVRKATCRILERHGFTTCEAGDGQQALDVFLGDPDAFMLIVLDMAMPVMGGLECFRRLRERSTVAVLVVSGYALEAETRTLLASGRSAFMEKPFAADQLLAQVDALLADEPARRGDGAS